jgi:hypothetical protein
LPSFEVGLGLEAAVVEASSASGTAEEAVALEIEAVEAAEVESWPVGFEAPKSAAAITLGVETLGLGPLEVDWSAPSSSFAEVVEFAEPVAAVAGTKDSSQALEAGWAGEAVGLESWSCVA